MGQSLTRAAQWTSAKGGAGGKLAFTPQNEAILNEIIKFADGFASRHPDEAKLVFKTPLSWSTTLDIGSFSGGGFRQQGEDFVSEALDDRTQTPLLKYEKDVGKNKLHVHSLEMVDKVLSIAGDKKLVETRACLEENRDPTANMLGDRFATVEGEDNSLLRFIEEMTKDAASSGDAVDDDARRDLEDKKRVLKLVLDIHQLDSKLLNMSIVAVSKETRLRPEAVATEVQVLKRFSGKDEEKHVLESIEFTDNYQYDNGCRAAPWRQMYGEIAYLLVKPHDTDEFYVTAATNGYFNNKGLTEKNELDYERDGDIYRDLVTLIKTKSPHFAELIDKQEFVLDERDRDELEYQDVAGDEVDDKGTGRELTRRADEASKQREKKKKKEEKKRYEPSLKWKTLGLEEGKEEEEKRKAEEKKAKEASRSKSKSKSQSRKKREQDEMSAEAFSESSSEDESEEETLDRRQEAHADLPSEYWQIQKLVKYLKGGNQTATIIALCAMRDFNLAQETCQLAIRDVGGLEVLINLLQTEEPKCKIGSLQILKEISKNPQIRRAIADLGGLPTMVKILRDPNKDLKCLAAETIANVAKFRRARRTVRQHGGIRRLVGLLQCPPMTATMTPEIEKDIEVARCGALALWSLSKSTKNKHAMKTAGVIPLLARLLKSPHENMLIPVVGSLQECASEQSYRLAIRTEGMIEDLVRNLARENPNEELQMHCASAIFKCAEEKATRDLVRRYEGLDPLVSLLSKADNKELLAAATGAIWKCSISPENVERFKELKAIDMLVTLLNDQPEEISEEVLVNVVGALSELAKDQQNRHQIRKAGGISPLVNLLTGTNQSLLVNTTRAVGHCAQEAENMAIIDRLDGVRLLWSLLKNQNTEVQASAAWAICPCIENAKEAGEMVRSFVGGLELIVSLLKSEDREVLASVCAAIANIAKDEENLAVITDHGVVPMLAKLTDTNDDMLRQHLAEAIARCCSWGHNRVSFGEENAVAPLVKYLRSKDEKVHRSTAHALYQLSRDPNNCVCMHESGVVKPLLGMVGSSDFALQEYAAGCIGNIRRLALANERADRA